MSELPVSVRLALWATAAFAGQVPLGDALEAAMADLEFVAGRIERLSTWADLGERAVLVALPHPGAPGLIPRGREVLAAATESGECVFVPGLGDVLVPTVGEFGPPDEDDLDRSEDRVGVVRWAAYDGEPVPVHAVDALDLREVDRRLRQTLVDALHTLEQLDVPPSTCASLRAIAEATLVAGRWGLPDGLTSRARRVIAQAGTLGEIAGFGLEYLQQDASMADTLVRAERLRSLRREADAALAEATCVAALHLAGWRDDTRD
ncbi:MAG: hypothetical protein ABI746_10260 [Dermatophilaceae bacterium]